METDRVNETY
ncbi:unnamed protein product, partial [Onchocerca ochengi]|uniref:Uncharacterized protein n=1 Tax=Onchocerca ochengi TaxID=42157 RepID=A0A182ESL6_ONCOC